MVYVYIYIFIIHILISYAHRYGKNATLSLDGSSSWTFIGLTACGQIIGQLFSLSIFPVSSNGGELLLLLGVSWMVYLVQNDLSITRKFADFLRRSNEAFQQVEGGEAVDPHATVPASHEQIQQDNGTNDANGNHGTSNKNDHSINIEMTNTVVVSNDIAV